MCLAAPGLESTLEACARIATFDILHGQPATGGPVDLPELQAAAAIRDADILGVTIASPVPAAWTNWL